MKKDEQTKKNEEDKKIESQPDSNESEDVFVITGFGKEGNLWWQ